MLKTTLTTCALMIVCSSPFAAELAPPTRMGQRDCTPDPAISRQTNGRPQALAKRGVPRQTKPAPFNSSIHSGAIIVKFTDGSDVRLVNGRFVRRGNDDIEAVNAAIQALATPIEPSRLFTASEEKLAADRTCGELRSNKQLTDLNLFYRLVPAGKVPAETFDSVIARLRTLAEVESAYLETKPAPPPTVDISPTTPDYETNQTYLDAAPSGIESRYAWTIPGGRGANVQIIDVEYEWNLSHEDITTSAINLGVMYSGFGSDHGTAVLGVLIGGNNGYGVTGIVADASFGTSSVQTFSNNFSVADAISSASLYSNTGDVILVEQQMSGPIAAGGCGGGGSNGYVPVEYDLATYSAVEYATSIGIIVVEAGGNGGVNLDDAAFGGVFDRGSLYFQDSGAIIVGAGETSGGTAGSPTCFTNYGSRVDAHGWGWDVFTAGYGDVYPPGTTDVNQRYTAQFNGTSSASPIVAGGAASIQGIQKARGGSLISPGLMRKILVENGTPQPSGPNHIGPLPDLKKTYQWMVADQDKDRVLNIDELVSGRNPYVNEAATVRLLFDE